MQEYLPRGDSFDNDNWNQLFEISVYKNQTVDPLHFAVNVGKVVQSHNPSAHFMISMCRNKQIEQESNEAVLDFLDWDVVSNHEQQVQFAEFNVFRFFYSENKKDIVAAHYARRFYFNKKDTPESLRKWLKNNRIKIAINLFWRTGIPVYNKEHEKIADFAPICKNLLAYFDDTQIK